MDDEFQFDGLSGSLLAAEDVLEAVLQEVDAAALRQLKAASVAWCNHARRELCNRLWVRLSRREGQPEPAGVDSITDLDMECLNEAGRPWEVVVAGRQLPQLSRLHGYGFVVDVQAVREADLEEDDDADAPLGGDTLRSCIQGEGQPPHELLLAAVACAASGTVRRVPVQRLREDGATNQDDASNEDDASAEDFSDEEDVGDLHDFDIGVTAATLLALMLPAATSLRSLNLKDNKLGPKGGVAIAEGLKGNSTLQSLSLAENDLAGETGYVDKREVQGSSFEVGANVTYDGRELTVSKEEVTIIKMIDLSGIMALAASLPECGLTSLDLEMNYIGAKGASALAAVLKETKITYLDLAANDIGHEGASALAAVLKESMISDLDLSENQLCGLIPRVHLRPLGTYTTEGFTKLCQGLKGSAVTSLRIYGNCIGDEGASALAAILKETKITNLSLGGNSIGVVGVSALAAILKETQITNLNLGSNKIGDEGALALAAILNETKITQLDLRRNDISEQAKQAVRDAAGNGVSIRF